MKRLAYCLALWLAAAPAVASSYYSACVDEAREAYRDCRDADGHPRACARDYEADRRHCARIERRAEHRDTWVPPPTWPQERFVPIPIPQRMPYILPGMR